MAFEIHFFKRATWSCLGLSAVVADTVGSDTSTAERLTRDMVKSSRAQVEKPLSSGEAFTFSFTNLFWNKAKNIGSLVYKPKKSSPLPNEDSSHAQRGNILYSLMLPQMLFQLYTEIKLFMCLHKSNRNTQRPSVLWMFLCRYTRAHLTWSKQIVHLRAL